jgi:branched-subunit amino acid ABC-type transport system permease component
LYGALALALVVVYRASGRINMAQGELATFGTYVSLVLHTPATAALAGTAFAARWLPGTPWPLWLAIPAAMVVSAVVAAAIERLVVRRVPTRSPRSAVSVTIGLLLLINAFDSKVWLPIQRGYPSPFPNTPTDYIDLAGARLRYATIGTWATLLALLGLLWLVLRYTRAGLAFRAVSSDRDNSALMGIHSGRVLTGGWALAAALGTLAGCLLANRLVLNPDMMVKLLVYGFAAATIGGLSSMGGALAGGLFVGVSQTMLGGYVRILSGSLSLPAVLALMIVILAFRPAGLFGRTAPAKVVDDPLTVTPSSDAGRPRWRIRRDRSTWRVLVALGIAAGIALAVLPGFFFPVLESRLWTEVVATSIILWGLGLLIGPAGQLSLGHGAFVGLGGYGVAIVLTRYGWPPYVGIPLMAVVGFVVGAILGLPALRIKGQYLAMVTLSFAVAFPMIVARFSWFTGGSSGPRAGNSIEPPSWFPHPADHPTAWLHLLVCAVAGLLLILTLNLLHSPIGRAIRASSQGDVAATVMGVNVVRVRTLAFGLASAFAAVGGGLLAVHSRVVTSEQFDLFRSLALYTAVVLGGAESLLGATVGALVLVGVPWLNLKFGWKVSPNLFYGLLILGVTALCPQGVVPTLRSWGRRVVRVEDAPPPPLGPPATERPASGGPGVGVDAGADRRAGREQAPAGMEPHRTG